MEVTKFQTGQRVITPKGEGEITAINGDQVQVKLNSGEICSFSKDKVSDDSDA